jgi:hypothetical protein
LLSETVRLRTASSTSVGGLSKRFCIPACRYEQ